MRARGVEAIRRAIAIATDLNCGALLLYAVRLGNGPRLEVGSQDTWDRFTAELTKVVPDAERAKILLNPENVWNKFLLSPLEMRSFVDQFHSPWVGTHFDAGNVMQYGYPEDWILTLGQRIKRIHFKDFKLGGRGEAAHFADLLEGDVNWKAVMAALVKVGYNGFISPEIGRNPSQPDQLKQVSAGAGQDPGHGLNTRSRFSPANASPPVKIRRNRSSLLPVNATAIRARRCP